MFILAIIIAVILGYILKGNIKNLENISLKGIYLIITAFSIELVINILIKNRFISSGILTYTMDSVMYILIFIFAIMNKKNPYIVVMSIGFFLNAIAILANGGTMPVSLSAIETTGITREINREGLYTLVNAQTHLSILCDILPVKFIGSFVVSIGDIVSAAGMILFVITSMKRTNEIKQP